MLVAAAIFGAGAYFKNLGPNQAMNTAAKVSGSQDSGQKKINTYVDAYNRFIGHYSFTMLYDKYREAHIASAKTSDNIGGVDDGNIPQSLEKLKAARAMSGGPSSLDAAADDLIVSTMKVAAHLADLKVYYSSKKYKDDNLVYGKQQDPVMLAEFKAADESLARFNSALDDELRRRDQEELTSLKNDNRMLAYDAKLALLQAKELLHTIRAADNPMDPALIQHVDPQVAQLESTLADLRKQVTAAKTAIKPGGDSSGANSADTVSNMLTELVGNYRTFKEGKLSYFDNMVEEYNIAINAANNGIY